MYIVWLIMCMLYCILYDSDAGAGWELTIGWLKIPQITFEWFEYLIIM